MVRNLLIFVVFVGFFQTIYWSCSGPKEGVSSSENPSNEAEVDENRSPVSEEVTTLPPITQEEITETSEEGINQPSPQPGAWNISAYLSKIQGKRLGLVVNQTSMVGNTHLLDTLLALGVKVEVIFAPEHGFRGEQDAGQKVVDGKDPKTGLPILSLYGKNKKPTVEELIPVDVLLFDIQDVGARFYTYLSTLHYVMEAAAEQGKSVLVLDRPNPNGHYVDGPVLDLNFSSFVGLHPVPVVYGMTIGEYAQMINGEAWLENGVKTDLEVIPCKYYDHQSVYRLPIKPSPNLPSQASIYLYPSLCFFEGTNINAGRGTDTPFQVYGAPGLVDGIYQYIPEPNAGSAKPKHFNKTCKGFNLNYLEETELKAKTQLDLSFLIKAYAGYKPQSEFFKYAKFFDLLAGSSDLREAILQGKEEETIRATWQNDLEAFQAVREKYLLYP